MNQVDNVNHPKHYEGHTSLECIEVMEICFGYQYVAHFCLCNAFKYLWRYKNKNGAEDLEKAGWYLDWIEGRTKEPFHYYYFDDEFMSMYARVKNLYSNILAKDEFLR